MNTKNDDVVSILTDGPILDWFWPWIVLLLINMLVFNKEPDLFFKIGMGLLAIGAVIQIASMCADKIKRIRALKTGK